MKTLVIFLNELSFASSISSEAMLPHVLSTLAAIRAVKRIRPDLAVAGHVPLSSVSFCDGSRPLAAVLRGDAHKDEWRFLRGLDQSNPWSAHPDLTSPGEFQEVICQGDVGIGMLWAKQNSSTVVSFAFTPNWDEHELQAELRQMDDGGNLVTTEITLPNLSKPEHSAVHRELITNYGRAVSSSSLIYEGEGFVVRIWFNDHAPPHFHVLMRRDTSDSLAKYKIETLDVLEGTLSPVLRRRVEEWATTRKEHLLACWARCRVGQHPFLAE